MNSGSYDAVIIGSGFGGAPAAYTLAQAGLKVLLLERGNWAKRDATDWNQRRILLEQRYKNPDPLLVDQYKRGNQPLYLNQTVGGMSVFYGGASLRLRPADFDRWPLTYAALEPYYARTEDLLDVHGQSGENRYEPPRSTDYPHPSPALTLPAQRIYTAAQHLGWTPCRIPLAINFNGNDRNHCIQCNTCDGFPCRIKAKNDLGVTLLHKAQQHGLEIMTGTIATRLQKKGGRITAVECINQQTQHHFSIQAKVFVLAAGALQSPAILLRSGIDNPFVGRYLMRHCNSISTGIFPYHTNPQQIFHKQLYFADFYEDMRPQLGTAVGIIQDIYTPSPDIIHHFAPWGSKRLAMTISPYMQNLLCIAEDEPQAQNKITLGRNKDTFGLEQIQVKHLYSPDDYKRRNYLIKRSRKILRRAGAFFCWTYKIDSFSHAVGSLRFGSSPAESALDPLCRFWSLDNLFTLDGSFMPTSGGVNPSLTIGANAFRVADHIATDFDRL